jgi:S-adenosylmethionine:tRNA ribosyltransferase-isomerase
MGMRTADFDYELPEGLIAQTPVKPRDSSRLLVLDRAAGSLQHRRFCDLPGFLSAGDVMVFNDSRVFPARLYGRKPVGGKPVGGRVELLLLERVAEDRWRALARPGRRLQRGTTFFIDGHGGELAEVLEVADDGTRLVRLPAGLDLSAVGVVPLPPYIKKPLGDPERYQTVYSRPEGSVAAPTAGLHFTVGLLGELRKRSVETVFVTLHVGWDSFRPVTVDDPFDHRMHSERYELSADSAATINKAKSEGRRVIVVGTTAVRLLESNADRGPNGQVFERSQDDTGGPLTPGRGNTDYFVAPGHEFKIVDGLVTNFHLPRSTLLMLVSAFAGRERVLAAYADAITQRYRFYSLGDAMVIL